MNRPYSTFNNGCDIIYKKSGWGDFEFIEHFYRGNGEHLTLSSIGHLESVKRQVSQYGGAFDIAKKRIKEMVSNSQGGRIRDKFEHYQDFTSVAKIYRGSIVLSSFEGSYKKVSTYVHVKGAFELRFLHKIYSVDNLIQSYYGTLNHERLPSNLVRMIKKGGKGFAVMDSWRIGVDQEVVSI